MEVQRQAWTSTVYEQRSHCSYCQLCSQYVTALAKGAITSKIKHAVKLKTTPARLAQLLQRSLAFCFSLQPMTAHRDRSLTAVMVLVLVVVVVVVVVHICAKCILAHSKNELIQWRGVRRLSVRLSVCL